MAAARATARVQEFCGGRIRSAHAEQAVAPDGGPRSLRSLGPPQVNGNVRGLVRMNRSIGTVTVMVLAILVGPLIAPGVSAAKDWRIGYLTATTPDLSAAWVATLRQGLRDLGY